MSPLRRRFIDDMRLRNLSPRTVEAYVHGIDDHRQKTMTLDALEFLRCFVNHVLPSGFVKARYYGLLANRFRDERLAKCRRLLLPAQILNQVKQATADYAEPQSLPERCCRACGSRRVEYGPLPSEASSAQPSSDSSSKCLGVKTIGAPTVRYQAGPRGMGMRCFAGAVCQKLLLLGANPCESIPPNFSISPIFIRERRIS